MQDYGQIYLADGVTAQTISATPAKMTGFATAGPASNLRSGGLGVVPVLASDKISVKAGGVYRVDFHCQGSTDNAGEVQANVRFNQVEEVQGQCRVAFGGNGTNAAGAYQLSQNGLSMSCIVEPTADGDIEIYLQSSVAMSFTPEFAQLLVTKIG